MPVPDLDTWAASVQAAVTAIRKAGASSQMILIPSTGYTGASTLVSSGSGTALQTVTNPDGSTTNLIYDVHQYFDSDGSGTSTECVSAKIDAFTSVATFMRTSKRQVFVSELGGGNSASCVEYVTQALAFLK